MLSASGKINLSSKLNNITKIVRSFSTSGGSYLFHQLGFPDREITDFNRFGASVLREKFERESRDIPLNVRIRRAYLEAEKYIDTILPVQEFDEQPSEVGKDTYALYAKTACELRQGMRWQARDFMNPDDVKLLHIRDTKKYEDPDGPSFEYLKKKYASGKDDVNELLEVIKYIGIYYGSQRSDRSVTRRVFGEEKEVISGEQTDKIVDTSSARITDYSAGPG